MKKGNLNLLSQLLARRQWNIADQQVLLLCMLLSLVLWAIVKLSKTYERRSVLSLDFNLPLGRTFAAPPQRQLPVKLAGTGWKLLAKGPFWQQQQLTFTLADRPTQDLSRSEIARSIEEQLGLSVVELGQDRIGIQLDTLFSKLVPVHLDTAISFANGYAIRDSIELKPDSVKIYGSLSLLNSIDEVRTRPLRMECPKQDFRQKLRLFNPYPNVVEMSANETEIFLPVEQFTEHVLDLPVLALNAKDSVRLLPGTVKMRCVVGISKYGQLTPSDFRVVADFEQPAFGNTSVPVAVVKQPKWVRSVQVFPKSVEYLIVQ